MVTIKLVVLISSVALATAQYQLLPDSNYGNLPVQPYVYGYPYPLSPSPQFFQSTGDTQPSVLNVPNSQQPYYVLPIYQQPLPVQNLPQIWPQNPVDQRQPFYQYPLQTYPYYQRQRNYPDPYSHIPTEMIDLDDDRKPLEASNSKPLPVWNVPKVHVDSWSTSTASDPTNNPYRSVHTSSTVTKPVQTTITRVFGPSGTSEPIIQVSGQDSDSNSGSGIVVEAHTNDDQVLDSSDEATVDINEESVEKETDEPSKFSLFG